MTRQDGRAYDELRPIKITTDFVKFAEGSCLIECGDTKVLCCASIEEKTPPHVAEGEGWVTAEYSMLPRANRERSKRDISKLKLSPRSAEIQRLVGRSLRAAVDMQALGERTINIDCDVLQGDGGTRTASVTGGFVALALACRKLVEEGYLGSTPIRHFVTGVSAGIVDEQALLDLQYSEDSRAQVDLNCIMDETGCIIELQGTGEGRAFTPVGGTLNHIARVDLSGLKTQLKGIELVAMCDIDNPLCGPQGAAAVFGPQKGADGAMVARLDEGLCHLAEVVQRDTGCDAMNVPGAGAAGGMGYGMLACFGAKLQMGIETVLDTVSFETLAQRADIILTGEGRMDGQSLRGKVVMGIARRAKPLGVPVVAVVGDIGDDITPAYEQGVTGIFSINRVAQDFEKVKARSKSDLALTMDNLVRFCVSMGL